MPRRGQARALQDAKEIRFADGVSFLVKRGVNICQGKSLAAERAGSVADRIAFGRRLATGLGGGEERVDVRVAGEVADDRSNGTDMKIEPLGDFVGGGGFVEVSATDLVVTLGWEIRLLEQASEFGGASHGC